MHCGKTFDGDKSKFCSQPGKDSHISELATRIHEAVNDDPSHTKKMSYSE